MDRPYTKTSLFGLMFCGLAMMISCSDQKIDTTAAREEMKAREIKVVPEAQVLEKALSIGNDLMTSLSFSLDQDSLVNKTPVSENDGPIISFYLYGSRPKISGKEKQLFEAYAYNAENSIKSEPNVQDLASDKMILFTAPVIIEGKEVGVSSIRIPRKYIINQIEN